MNLSNLNGSSDLCVNRWGASKSSGYARIQHTLPQEIELGATIHRPFDELQPVHASLRLPLTVRQCQCGHNRSDILPQLRDEGFEFGDVRLCGLAHPVFQL